MNNDVIGALDDATSGALRKRLALRYALLALCTHVIFITASLVPGWRADPLITGDSFSYIRPAENLVAHGVYSRELAAPYFWEPSRPPGYPLLLAASLRLFGGYSPVLYLSAITACLAAFAGVSMAYRLGGAGAARAAGLLLAFLPNSLGLAGMLLTDAIAGHLTLVWMWMLTTGLTRRSWLWLCGSAIVMVILQSLKPVFNLGVVLIAVVVWLSRPRTARRFIVVGLLGAATLPLPAFLACQNLRSNGVFAPTLLDAESARQYLQARYVSEQTGKDYSAAAADLVKQDLAAAERLDSPPSRHGRLYLISRREIGAFYREHPVAAARLMASEFLRQFLAPHEFAQRVFKQDLSTIERGVGSLFTVALYVLTCVGGWRLFGVDRGRAFCIAAMTMVFFLGAASIGHMMGARIRFPADLIAIPLASVGAAFVTRQSRAAGITSGSNHAGVHI